MINVKSTNGCRPVTMLAVIARGERLMLTSLDDSPLIDVGAALEALPVLQPDAEMWGVLS